MLSFAKGSFGSTVTPIKRRAKAFEMRNSASSKVSCCYAKAFPTSAEDGLAWGDMSRYGCGSKHGESAYVQGYILGQFQQHHAGGNQGEPDAQSDRSTLLRQTRPRCGLCSGPFLLGTAFQRRPISRTQSAAALSNDQAHLPYRLLTRLPHKATQHSFPQY